MRVVTSSWTTTASLLQAVLVKIFFFYSFTFLSLRCCFRPHGRPKKPIINAQHTRNTPENILQWLSFYYRVASYPKRKKKERIQKVHLSQMVYQLKVGPVIIISPPILLPALGTRSSRLGSRCTCCCRGCGSGPVAGRRSSSRRRRVRVGPRDAHSSCLITATIVVVAVVTVAVIRTG